MPIDAKSWQYGLHSQSACNLSGLAISLVGLFDELRASGITDTDSLNTHPLVRLVVAQMAYLAYGSFDCGAGNNWQRAFHLAEMETGRHPYYDRPLEAGEKERTLTQWPEDDRSIDRGNVATSAQ